MPWFGGDGWRQDCGVRVPRELRQPGPETHIPEPKEIGSEGPGLVHRAQLVCMEAL